MSLLSLLREDSSKKSFDDIKSFSNSLSGAGSIIRYEDAHIVPITVQNKDNGWEVIEDPERLSKAFIFANMKEVLYFTNELYKYQFDINHHCKIIIDNLVVTVETYTHGFEGITEMDMKIKKHADELENDLNYFKRSK